MTTADAPHCVFCDAPWTPTMLALYDAGTSGAVCSCCVIFPDLEDEPPPPPPKVHIALPDELNCESCGRTLYRLMKN